MFCEGKDVLHCFGYLKIEILLDIQVELLRIQGEVWTEDEMQRGGIWWCGTGREYPGR